MSIECYECKLCGEEFGSEPARAAHLLVIHGEPHANVKNEPHKNEG